MYTCEKSEKWFEEAKSRIPGGVNSPVRAFRSVGSTPLFIQRAEGSRIVDVDGNVYIDYVGSWGPMILGHAHPVILERVADAMKNGLSFGAPTGREVEIARLIHAMVPSVELVRMVNSGTEAVMSAVRVARGYTGRDKVVKFEGCYHGHSDGMLVKAGSGVMTAGVPDSAGVPAHVAQDTLTARFNDAASVERLFAENKNQIAAVIVEPVAANMGVVPPQEGFLQELRRLCSRNGALLIFDEVITGFRLAPGGAQEYFGVTADLVTYGKIIGGGMPVGAYGGRKDVMEHVAPVGSVYQAGTLSGNPVAMAAGLAQLEILHTTPAVYEKTAQLAKQLGEGLKQIAASLALPMTVNRVGSLLCPFFTAEEVTNYEQAKTSNIERFAAYFNGMKERGIYLAPSQFEAVFLSAAHTEADIGRTLTAAQEVLGRF